MQVEFFKYGLIFQQDETGQLNGYATREVLKSVDSLAPADYEKLNNVGDICVVEGDYYEIFYCFNILII